jgi:hypothetical protein
VLQGDTEQAAYILQAGWGCSSKLLPDGGRQIITFPLPGDCIGLRSVLLRTSDHSFSAVTDAIVTRVEVSRILRLCGLSLHWCGGSMGGIARRSSYSGAPRQYRPPQRSRENGDGDPARSELANAAMVQPAKESPCPKSNGLGKVGAVQRHRIVLIRMKSYPHRPVQTSTWAIDVREHAERKGHENCNSMTRMAQRRLVFASLSCSP